MSYVVFATSRYEYLRTELCAGEGFVAGALETATFPDGERHLVFEDELHGRDVIVIGGTVDDAATLDLYDMACGLIGLGINKLSLVIPYFGYSTQERATRRGEVVVAKARAVLLSSIPRARVWNEALLVDLHTPGIAHYFEGHLHAEQLTARDMALGIVRQTAAAGPTVVACTDAGRAKWVQGLANEAGLPAAFVYKARIDGGKTAVTGVNADVAGKHVVLYDDMIRTGGSLVEAARAYQKAGATAITAVATHGVLPGESLAKIKASGLFKAVHVTDTHPRVRELEAAHKGFLVVHGVCGLLRGYFRGEMAV